MTTRTHPPGKTHDRSDVLTVSLIVVLWTTILVGFIMACVVLMLH